MMCSSGPPCWPGNTAESIFLAYCSLQRIIPPRPPPIVLWIVVVTTSANGTGEGAARPRRAREMGHVDHQVRADRVGDLAEALEVELARVGRPAGDDHLRPVLLGEALHLVHVDQARLAIDVVGDDLVQPARDVDLHPVGEMAAVGQLEPHQRVPRRAAAPGRRPCWPARRRAAARSRARRRTAPWRDRSRAARRCRRTRSRRSSGGRDSPRRTCWSAPCPGTRAPQRGRSSRTRSSRASAVGARARAPAPRRSRDRLRRAGG